MLTKSGNNINAFKKSSSPPPPVRKVSIETALFFDDGFPKRNPFIGDQPFHRLCGGAAGRMEGVAVRGRPRPHLSR